jgi:hypothetical protein
MEDMPERAGGKGAGALHRLQRRQLETRRVKFQNGKCGSHTLSTHPGGLKILPFRTKINYSSFQATCRFWVDGEPLESLCLSRSLDL